MFKFIRSYYFSLYWLLIFFCYACEEKLIGVEFLTPIVISKIPHDTKAFTQGLAIDGDLLYESTGLYGQSDLRCIDLLTGKLIKKISLPSDVFAEGVAVFPEEIFQLTWREKQVLIYERSSLKRLKYLSYQGEGWGLCRDGDTVWMSNGSAILVQRNLKNFAIQKKLTVRLNGQPLSSLNDLECVGNHLYANIWCKDWIVRIDKKTGEITGVINMSNLLFLQERSLLSYEAVLNGIAFRPSTETFFVTGKYWPWMFEVRFITQK